MDPIPIFLYEFSKFIPLVAPMAPRAPELPLEFTKHVFRHFHKFQSILREKGGSGAGRTFADIVNIPF